VRTIGVRLQRLDLYDGPIAVRLVDRANNFHHDPGLVTDGALAERLASSRLGMRDTAVEITRKLLGSPSEAAFSTKWPTFEHAIEHWTGEQSRSPVKRVTWTCLNVFCGFSNGIEIGARRHETTPLKCRQCGRTQRVGLDGKN
jgi:hypothetical protein